MVPELLWEIFVREISNDGYSECVGGMKSIVFYPNVTLDKVGVSGEEMVELGTYIARTKCKEASNVAEEFTVPV
ncbi:hypothetical protein ACFQMA_23940 [Halosimplex aquaticum]|uniref:Uncharacterized protein n=1 Tax=Halosimplex aquaticum TaxID=3026162 RepID=A0ABD5Y6I8_9EURY|nr:hypothetical protein [Halosimplex aquaticum]